MERRGGGRRLGVGREKRDDALPGLRRRGGVLLVFPVEEAVRRTGEDDELMLDVRGGEVRLERGVLLREDVRVGARLQREDRRLHRRRATLGRTAVEADRTRELVPG